ncbi:MAG: 4Fe-4S dicluster domain-containing protein [Bryobacteraceae bacterium]
MASAESGSVAEERPRIPGALPQTERALRRRFLEEAQLVPGGSRISQCLQCGTCTGSCPVSYAMDISPRMVIALFRAGQIEEILRSRTIWICASCYMCTTRCPQSIKITDLLYALKRTAVNAGLYPDRFPVYLLSRNFVRIVNRYGRNHESLLLLLYYLQRNPLALFRLLPLGIALLRKGRASPFPSRIKGVDTIRTILRASGSLELPREKEAIPYAEGAVGYRAIDKAVPERLA